VVYLEFLVFTKKLEVFSCGTVSHIRAVFTWHQFGNKAGFQQLILLVCVCGVNNAARYSVELLDQPIRYGAVSKQMSSKTFAVPLTAMSYFTCKNSFYVCITKALPMCSHHTNYSTGKIVRGKKLFCKFVAKRYGWVIVSDFCNLLSLLLLSFLTMLSCNKKKNGRAHIYTVRHAATYWLDCPISTPVIFIFLVFVSHTILQDCFKYDHSSIWKMAKFDRHYSPTPVNRSSTEFAGVVTLSISY